MKLLEKGNIIKMKGKINFGRPSSGSELLRVKNDLS